MPIDLTTKYSWKSVIPQILNLVNTFKGKIYMIHVVPDYGMAMVEDYLPKNWFEDQYKRNCEHIEALIAKYIPQDIDVEYCVTRGAVYDQVIQYADKIKADLIVVSAVRPELRDYMLGPNASKIVRHSKTSVLVIR